jgi:predicted dehydrogenase
MSVGIALIGCGLIGEKRSLGLPAGARVVSVFDIDETRAVRLASKLTGSRVAASADDAMAAPGVDLVIVATIHRELARLALDAVELGRNVLVEKPGAHALEPLTELRIAAERAGCHVRVGFNHRFHPALLAAHEIVSSGRYGRLLHVRGRYGHGGRVGYEREWRADRDQSGGGELLDQGIHLIDLTRFLAGDVELAFSELRTDFWPMEVEDNAFLALRARSGAFAWLHASWTEWKNLFSLEIVIERAKLEITGLGGSYGVETLRLHEMSAEMGPPLTTSWEWPRPDESWTKEVEDVLAAVGGGAATGASLDDAIAAWRIVDEAYRT